MKNSRTRAILFKLIPGLVLALLLLKLISLLIDFASAPDEKEYEANRKINLRNFSYSKGNTYGFTDRERTRAKSPGIYRIMVLGDSFIWGDGIDYERVWSHILERKLLAAYDSVEVCHWGVSGWSTKNEFDFFREHGKDYDIDLLLIGWVDNDPDLGAKVKAKDPAAEYPGIYKVWPSLAQRLVNGAEDSEYEDWLNNLYSKENLVEYGKLLATFRTCLDEQKVPAIFVMTPGPFNEEMKVRFAVAETMIRHAGFPCFNLYSAAERKLGHYSTDQLQASRVNGHPGILMTEEFAAEVKDSLQANHYLDRLHKK